MKCEICHKHNAEQAIIVKRDGKDCELYVCKACAKSQQRPPSKKPKSKPSVTVVGPGEEPPPFVKNFLEATLGLVKGMAENPEERHLVCPTCHATWDKIRETRRLDCPTCWKTFAKEVQTEFLRSQYGPTHIGLPPAGIARSTAGNSRAQLERALKTAIAREDYRKASEIQKQLESLKDGGACT